MSIRLGIWTRPESAYITLLGSITKCHRLSSLNNRNLFSHSCIGWSPRSRCHQGWFLLRFLSLACRWLSSPCVYTWCSSVFVCVLVYFYYKDTSHIGLETTHITPFQINYLFKTYLQIQSCSEILAVRTSTYELGEGTQFNPLSSLLTYSSTPQSPIHLHWALLAANFGPFPIWPASLRAEVH